MIEIRFGALGIIKWIFHLGSDYISQSAHAHRETIVYEFTKLLGPAQDFTD